MDTILNVIKELLEVDIEESIFDNQLLIYLNGGIAYLKNNKVPITRVSIDSTTQEWLDNGLIEGDEDIVIQWLHLYALQRFDRSLMNISSSTTQEWIDNELSNLIHQLKVRYDNEVIV